MHLKVISKCVSYVGSTEKTFHKEDMFSYLFDLSANTTSSSYSPLLFPGYKSLGGSVGNVCLNIIVALKIKQRGFLSAFITLSLVSGKKFIICSLFYVFHFMSNILDYG